MAIKVDPTSLYSVKDLQGLLGVSRNTIFDMIIDRRLPANKIGKKHLWSGELILRSLATPSIQSDIGR